MSGHWKLLTVVMVLLFLSEVYAGVMVQTAALSTPASNGIVLHPATMLVGNATTVSITGSGFTSNASVIPCQIIFKGVSPPVPPAVFSSCAISAGNLLGTSFPVSASAVVGVYEVDVNESVNSSSFIIYTAPFTITNPTATSTTTGASSAITVYSSPEIPDAVYVDSTPISYSQTFHWQVGTTHTLTAYLSSDNAYGQNNYQFQYWEMDGEIYSYDQMISYVADASSHTFVAVFGAQGGACLQWQGNVCVQWQGTTQVGCLQWQGNVCLQWQGATQVISTQTMRLTSTSTLFTTMITTTTGYATTQVSTTGESIYVTEVERSYGTITNTQYVYVASYLPNNTLSNSSTTAGAARLNFGSLVAGLKGYLPVPPLALAGAVAILVLVSAFMMRRRRRGKVTERTGDSAEMEATLLDYINAHNGMISMSQASEDLGVSREPLGEAILRLKADGKLPQAWTHLKVGGE